MSKRKSQGGKIKGIYWRGNIFWYGRMVHGKRIQVSLHTSDYGEAVVKALEIRGAVADLIGEGCGVCEIARRLAIPLSSAHKLVKKVRKRTPVEPLATALG